MIKMPSVMRADRDRYQRDLDRALAQWPWECDADGVISFLSPEFEASTGVLPSSLFGKRIAELPVADAGLANQQRAAMIARSPFCDLVFKLERPDGSGIWVEMAGTPVFNAGAFQGYWGIAKTVTAKVKTELALRKSERRYRELFEVASDWFWETDTENRFVYISPNVEAGLGLLPASHYGRRISEIDGVTIERESGRASLAAWRARQPFENFIYSRKLSSGKIVWVASNGAPYFTDDGTFLGYRGITRDVTAQIEAQRALHQSEMRFRELYEIGSDYYWEFDEKFRLTFVSPESFHDELYGVPAAQLYGKRMTESLNVSFDGEMGRRGLLAQKARQPWRDIVFSIKHPSGRTRWVSSSAAPIFDDQGQFRGYRGIGVEITARVEAEVAMRLSQRQLHDAVAHVSQPIAVFDAAGRVMAFNQAFADLHRTPTVNTPVRQGVMFRELAEWQLQMGFYAEGPEEPAIDAEKLLEHYQSGDERTYQLRDDRWMMVVYRSLPGDAKLALWTDITALKRAEAERLTLEAQLHHSQRLEALGTLAGGAAHEINNALVPCISLTKLMASKQPEGSRERRNLDLILAGAERSRDLVKQIVAFSRKGDEQHKEKIDVAAVLLDALQLLRATIPATINLAQDVSPVPLISGDPGQIHQVIVNLVSNAAQAVGEAVGTITLGLRPEPDGRALRLWVADTGCGMDEATKARIFEPFFTTKEVGEGTGLGLAVVHGIIKSHAGLIEVESALGRGSRFDVVLPAAAVETVVAA